MLDLLSINSNYSLKNQLIAINYEAAVTINAVETITGAKTGSAK